jgi:hypothetical protein
MMKMKRRKKMVITLSQIILPPELTPTLHRKKNSKESQVKISRNTVSVFGCDS